MGFQVINDENFNPFYCAPPASSRPSTRICQTQDPNTDVENPFITKPLNFSPRNVQKRRIKSHQSAAKLPPIKRSLSQDLEKSRTGAVEFTIFQRDPKWGPLSCSTRDDSLPGSSTKNFMSRKEREWINIVIVGDPGCGKTTLAQTFTGQHFDRNQFLRTFEKTTSLNKSKEEDDDDDIGFKIWDVSGLSDFDRVRPLAYASADGILCCFSIDDIRSFNNVEERWLPELQVYCENCPIILVGLKNDLRKVEFHMNIPYETCKNFAHAVSMNYFQCSSINGQVDFVFKSLARMVIKKRLKLEKQKSNPSPSPSIRGVMSLHTIEGQQHNTLSTEISAVAARVAVAKSSMAQAAPESLNNKAHSFSTHGKRRTMTSSMRSGTTAPESHNNNPNNNNSKRITRMDSMMTLRTPKREKCTIM